MLTRLLFRCYGLFLLCCLPCATASQMGRLNILCEVHGYHTGTGVVVPLRGVAEWVGAEVTFSKPRVKICLGAREVLLSINSSEAAVNGRKVRLSTPAREYGGMVCVPVRFVAEALGYQVQQVSDAEQLALTAEIPHVLLSSEGKRARVLMHRVPPDKMQGIIKAYAQTDGGVFGRDWVIRGEKELPAKHVWTTDPYGWDEDGFLCEGDNGMIWAFQRGGWRQKGFVGLDSEWAHDLRRDGVPDSVIRALKADL